MNKMNMIVGISTFFNSHSGCESQSEEQKEMNTLVQGAIADSNKDDQILDSNNNDKENYQELSLPYGWKKMAVKRKSGILIDHWDFYVISPAGKRLRSNKEIARYLEANSELECDLKVTNTNMSGFNFQADKQKDEKIEIDEIEAHEFGTTNTNITQMLSSETTQQDSSDESQGRAE